MESMDNAEASGIRPYLIPWADNGADLFWRGSISAGGFYCLIPNIVPMGRRWAWDMVAGCQRLKAAPNGAGTQVLGQLW